MDPSRLLTPERLRFLKFCVVGLTGLFVNEFVLWLCFDQLYTSLSPGQATTDFALLLAFGGGGEFFPTIAVGSTLPYIPSELTNVTLFLGGNRLTWAGATGIAVAIFTNFLLNNAWTWRDRGARGGRHFFVRLLQYYAVASVAGVVQWSVLKVLTESFGILYLISNLIGIAAGLLINFGVNNVWTFRKAAGP